MDLVNSRLLAGTPMTAYPHRVQAYVALAIYDAMVATWESKYFYHRPRPSEMDRWLPTALQTNSPSYPSEHAAAAQAAATVLAHFLPAEAAAFQTMAEAAGWSRVLAGLQYPSDYHAGLDLGAQPVGPEQVIAKAMADGSSIPPTGIVPTGPCKWIGTNPGNQAAANWAPLLLISPAQFRPSNPPACDSAQVQAEAEAVRTFPRTFVTTYKAFYWQSPEGLQTWPFRHADKWMFEDGLDQNPPRAARTVRADCRGDVRRLHCESGRQVRVLVHQAVSAQSGHRSVVRGAAIPKLSVRTTRRSLPPDPRCSRICSRRARISFAPWEKRRATREYGQAFISRWITLLAWNSGSRSPSLHRVGATRRLTALTRSTWGGRCDSSRFGAVRLSSARAGMSRRRRRR